MQAVVVITAHKSVAPNLVFIRFDLRVLGDKVNTLLDVLLQVSKASLEELLLVSVDLTNRVNLLDTVRTELNARSEEVDTLVLVEGTVDEGGLNNTLDTLSGLKERFGETGTGESHGEGGGTSTVLGLDDFVTTELDAVNEGVTGLALNVGVVGLGQERDDGHTGVATDDGDLLVGRVGGLDLGDEARGTDDIKSGDTEEALGVVDALGLEDLSDNGDGRVDRVGDDEDFGIGRSISSGLGEVTDDGSIGVEEIVTSHARLARNTGRDEDNLGVGESLLQSGGSRVIASDSAVGVDVAEISGNTRATADVVKSKLANTRVELHQQRQRLADTTCSTENGDLGSLASRSGESPLLENTERLTSSEHDG